MKKWTILLLISFSYLSVQSAHATSGRTNASGCHNSKKAGYHCHGTSKASSYKPQSKVYSSKSKTTHYLPAEKNKEIDGLVYGIQVQLNALGYKAGKVDGILGRDTISAIKKFQADNNLFIDGFATHRLLMKLVKANN
ncbi:peptidoglycan-binding domain-containing protein [Pseudoalteromonas espejiana]|uniref:Peptidoglycan binding-like domain-containing protein n=1 Tax=Pseudoalteromonas espejiana TaxID=28107 RepID=A0A510XXN7_9GAMM|nr:peptidoglycan-binding domain-containing protein [Pseudoalteromonas espejiana]GEK55772.1 hypothetical protein PES01_26170 [Pseudoalteromonas espejiana]